MKKAILFYNPNSGGRTMPSKIDFIIEKFQLRNVLIQPVRLTQNFEQVVENVLNNNSYDYAVIAGGDGTLNGTVNIILKHTPSLPIGLIPAGTSNDFCRCLEIPNSIEKAVNIILNDNLTKVDVGLINNSHYFLSTCSGGMFVDVSFNTDSELKKNFGPVAYYLKALSKAVSIKSFPIRIKTDTLEIDEEIILFLILNGKHAAGFNNIDEDADIADGIMNILVVKNCSPIDLANMFFKVLSHKNLTDQYVTKIRAKKCTISCDTQIDLSVDGEQWNVFPKKVEFIKKHLNVFVPSQKKQGE